MRTFRRICVYCGSNSGREVYVQAAADLGRTLAERGIGVVYGGGRVGLMGVLADSALKAGGEVIGVIPEKLLALEVGHNGLTERFVTDGAKTDSSSLHQCTRISLRPQGKRVPVEADRSRFRPERC